MHVAMRHNRNCRSVLSPYSPWPLGPATSCLTRPGHERCAFHPPTMGGDALYCRTGASSLSSELDVRIPATLGGSNENGPAAASGVGTDKTRTGSRRAGRPPTLDGSRPRTEVEAGSEAWRQICRETAREPLPLPDGPSTDCRLAKVPPANELSLFSLFISSCSSPICASSANEASKLDTIGSVSVLSSRSPSPSPSAVLASEIRSSAS
mmetsp:Transcript_7805/g.25559  ORF Transcript_7805/g.25559 Transcript_7805/m.25559 type:complete len:209 (+) Transcript_7805:189-815(+)